MSELENQLQSLENDFPMLSGIAFASARAQVLLAGHSIMQTEGETLYEVFPDGRKLPIKKIEPPLKIMRGRKILIK